MNIGEFLFHLARFEVKNFKVLLNFYRTLNFGCSYVYLTHPRKIKPLDL